MLWIDGSLFLQVTKKRLKYHLLGSLAMFKEVVFLVSCMENDERIIMELEAGSRRPLWGRGNL